MTLTFAGALPAAAAVVQITSGTSGAAIDTAARVAGTVIFAGFLAAAVALAYRWYVRERVPSGLALLVGLAGVALVAGTTSLLAQELTPGANGPGALTALLNVVTFLVGGLGAYAGMRAGDGLGVDLFAASGGDGVEGEVSELVKAVGRVISVEIPVDIDDVVGYDPVPEATKETLAGRTFLFPRRLTRAELRERFVARLKTDYGVGHADVEFDDAGGIEYLALGSRAAGIGPTLPPATNAVAIRADPAHAAQSGDLVQVWETGPMRRVLTGELRGVAGEIVTVAIDAADTPKLDPTTQYKLVTLPVQDRPDREFASLLRAADETLATITVQPGSRADGMHVAELGVTVAAITREDEPPTPLPARDRQLRGGDVLYAIATPDTLRRLEAATEAADGVVVDDSPARGSAGTDRTGEQSTAPGDGVGAEADPEETPPESSGGADTSEPTEPESGESAASSDSAGEQAETDDSDPIDDEAAAGAASADESTDLPSGGAFPDSDDLPGIDPETAMKESTDGWDDEGGDDRNDGEPTADDETGGDGDETDGSIPDSAAFPDTDDLAGLDVSDDAPEFGTDDAAGTDDAPVETTDSSDDEAVDSGADDDSDQTVSDDGDAGDSATGFDDLLDETASDDDLDDGLDDLLDEGDDEEAEDEVAGDDGDHASDDDTDETNRDQ